MERKDLSELHFIAPIENMPSIMRIGIVSNRRSSKTAAISIALADVQAKREAKRVPGGRMLHEYANLYFNARNPMMFKRKDMHESICVVSVDPAVIDLPNVVITDQNAASKWARFAAAPDGLVIVNVDMTFAENWKHPGDQILEWRHSSAMCAEVLVPDSIPPKFINSAYVAGDAVAAKMNELGLKLKVVSRRHLFFR